MPAAPDSLECKRRVCFSRGCLTETVIGRADRAVASWLFGCDNAPGEKKGGGADPAAPEFDDHKVGRSISCSRSICPSAPS